jgi:hypothetical protein
MAEFRLSKWYLDGITPEGHTSIQYTGVVEFGPVRLHYSSLLESKGGVATTRYSLRPQPQPAMEGGLRETIFESGAGSVEWHCVVPSGPARVGDPRGWGYVEHLTMTVPPWKLPIERNRNRFRRPYVGFRL